MRTNLIFALLFFLLLLISSLTIPTGYRLKQAVSLQRPWDTTTYIYDSEGRLTNHKTLARQETYIYLPSQVQKTADNNQYTQSIYYLNKQGRADSSIVLHNGEHMLCLQYKYDTDGFLIITTTGCDNSRVFEARYYYENGNLTKRVFYDNGTESDKLYYEYYTGLPNRPTIQNDGGSGITFMGKQSQNLLKRMVMLNSKNDTTDINLHHYILDKKGRITLDITINKTGMSDSVKYFY